MRIFFLLPTLLSIVNPASATSQYAASFDSGALPAMRDRAVVPLPLVRPAKAHNRVEQGVIESAQQQTNAYLDEVMDCELGLGSGACERAIALLDRRLARSPGDAEALGHRGGVHAVLEDYGRAIDDYSRAIRVQPGNPFNYYFRGEIYEQTGQRDRAINDFRRVLEINPGAGQAREALERLGAE